MRPVLAIVLAGQATVAFGVPAAGAQTGGRQISPYKFVQLPAGHAFLIQDRARVAPLVDRFLAARR